MIVVFDTNAYRDLAAGKTPEDTINFVNSIVKKEAVKGIKAYMSTIVAMELLYHFQDDTLWRSYRSCIKAAPAMYLHCGDENQFRSLPLPEVQVAKMFYKVEASPYIQTQDAIGKILYVLIHDDATKVAVEYATNLKMIRQFIEDAEKALASVMDKLLTDYDPNYKHDWYPFVGDESNRRKYLNMVDSDEFYISTAKGFIIAVGKLLYSQGLIKRILQNEELDDAANSYVKYYGPSLLFRRKFFRNLAGGGFDITKDSRANYIWDEYIMHFAGHSVNGEQIMIVTSDANIKRAIQEYNQEMPVMTLKEYLRFLGCCF